MTNESELTRKPDILEVASQRMKKEQTARVTTSIDEICAEFERLKISDPELHSLQEKVLLKAAEVYAITLERNQLEVLEDHWRNIPEEDVFNIGRREIVYQTVRQAVDERYPPQD